MKWKKWNTQKTQEMELKKMKTDVKRFSVNAANYSSDLAILRQRSKNFL